MAVGIGLVAWSLLLIAVTLIAAQSYSISLTRGDSPGGPSCSRRGVFQQDTSACECFQCAFGSGCEELRPGSDCVLNVGGSQPFLLEEYWNNYTLAKGYPLGVPLAFNYRV